MWVMRWWVVGLMAVQVACKTAAPTPDVAPSPPVPPQPVAKANAVRARGTPFDVSACAPVTLPVPLTTETLAAFLEVERPRFEQCLAPTSSREAPEASAELAVTVTARVAQVTVEGRGLSAAAKTCLEETVAGLGLSAAGSTSARLSVVAPVGSPEPGASGVPEVEALRQAIARACACFASVGVNAPPQLVVQARSNAPLDVVTASDIVSTRVERCLEETVVAPSSTLELTVDLPLLNGEANQTSPDASPDIVAAQELAMARRHVAQANLLVARRVGLKLRLDALAISLKRKPTPALRKERGSLCQMLFEVDDDLTRRVRQATDAVARVKGFSASVPKATLEPVQTCAGLSPTEEESAP